MMGEEVGHPIIIYNVVPWSYLSPELLCRIMDEVPAVVGVKQSAGDLKLFADLMLSADPEHLIFCARGRPDVPGLHPGRTRIDRGDPRGGAAGFGGRVGRGPVR